MGVNYIFTKKKETAKIIIYIANKYKRGEYVRLRWSSPLLNLAYHFFLGAPRVTRKRIRKNRKKGTRKIDFIAKQFLIFILTNFEFQLFLSLT